MQIELFGIMFHALEVPLLILAVAAMLHQLLTKGMIIRIREKKPVVMFFGFLMLYMLAIFISGIDALDRNLIVKAMFKWLEILVLAFLIFFYVDSWKRFRYVYSILFGLILLEILYVYSLVLFNQVEIFDYRIFPGSQAVIGLALIIPFVIKTNKPFIIITLAILFAIYFSLSRGAYLATFFVLYYNLRFISKNKRASVVIGLIGFLLLFLFTSGREVLIGRWQFFFSSELGSNIERFQLLRLGLETFWNHPITGVGSLNFPIYTFRDGIPPGIGAKNLDTLGPHNTFLQVAAEEGLLGLLTFLAVFWIIGKVLYQKRDYPAEMVRFVIGLQGAFIALFFHLFFGFISAQLRIYLSILFALVLACTRLAQENGNEDNIAIQKSA